MKLKIFIIAFFVYYTSLSQTKIKKEETKIESSDISVRSYEETEDVDVPFAVVEKIPMFADCDYISDKEDKVCFTLKMNEHIAKNIVYPKTTENTETSTKVFVMFLIEKDGSISKIFTKCSNN